MTPEAQRIAIAIACGWKVLRQKYSPSAKWDMWAVVHGNQCVASGCKPAEGAPDVFSLEDYVRITGHLHKLPDYLGDLNAMHEAEKVLSSDDRQLYATWVSNLVLGHGSTLFSRKETVAFISATAAKRAEAFLRTLGLWKDELTAPQQEQESPFILPSEQKPKPEHPCH